MNKKEKSIKINSVQRRYHIPGQSHLYPRKRNAVFLSSANSWEHEKVKSHVCWLLLRRKLKYVTEAVRNVDGVRVDVVVLDTGDEIEIVCKNRDKKTLERYEKEKVIIIFTDQNVEEQLEKQLSY